MHTIADSLEAILADYTGRFRDLSESYWSTAPAPGKWSPREVLGHLVDSAANNLRRFVVGQYEQSPRIIYDQDAWVRSQAYREADTAELIELWRLLNLQLARTLRHIPADRYHATCDTGKEKPALHTLSFLAEDYLDHLLHHLRQVSP